MKNLFTTICIALLFQTNLIAQDENCPACGWYVDGVKVDKLTCYSFDKLQVVLPYKSGWSGYDKINIIIGGENKAQAVAMKTIDGDAIKSFVKGNYLVYTVFAKEYGQVTDNMTYGRPYESQWSKFKRGGLANGEKTKGAKKGDPAPDGKPLVVYAEVGTITGYTENFDQGCNCVKKTPNFSYAYITKEYPLTMTNRTVQKSGTLDEVDLSVPCVHEGIKVDFNNLSK